LAQGIWTATLVFGTASEGYLFPWPMADASEASNELSKSAKRRAAKKARDAAAQEEPAAPAPAPAPTKTNAKAGYPESAAAPKAKAKAKAQEAPPAPAAAPEPKAKAKAKAKAVAEPPVAVAEPKAKAKATAKATAKAAEEPKAAAPEPKAKAKAKASAAAPKAKAAAKAKEEEDEEPKKKAVDDFYFEMDDGKGGDWEVSTGLNKKQQKRQDRMEAEKKAVVAAGGQPGKPMVQQGYIPGMAPPPSAAAAAKAGAPAVDQSVAATAAAAALLGAKAEAEAKAAEGNATTVTINVPESKIGIVIGPKGAKIKMIQEKTGVTRIDTSGEVFTISGPPEAVAQAQTAIKELLDKGYTSLSFDNFSENFVAVHPSVFPDLIGKQGAIIRAIKEALGTEINIPPVPKNADPKKKFKVMIAGSAAAVEKTKAVINDIATYGHSEISHPGQGHEEMEVAEWCYRYLIGKGGSEMRHIQNNYKVKVNIPRETSACQNVVIVGDKDNVTRAKAYIEKLIWNAENTSKGRDRADGSADDGWGEEDAEEDWMKAYLFKR